MTIDDPPISRDGPRWALLIPDARAAALFRATPRRKHRPPAPRIESQTRSRQAVRERRPPAHHRRYEPPRSDTRHSIRQLGARCWRVPVNCRHAVPRLARGCGAYPPRIVANLGIRGQLLEDLWHPTDGIVMALTGSPSRTGYGPGQGRALASPEVDDVVLSRDVDAGSR
jgi:hypothetical protein